MNNESVVVSSNYGEYIDETNKKLKYLVLWITERCNLSCKYCYAKSNISDKSMDFYIAKRALDKLNDNSTVILAGGEPLLNFDLIEKICTYIRKHKKGIKINIQSNGTLLTESIGKKLREFGVGIGISLDGMPKVNDINRGRSGDVIKGIDMLKSIGVSININAVVTKNNVRSLHELVDLALCLGNVKGIGLDLLRERNKEVEKASSEEIYALIKRMHDRCEEVKRLTGVNIYIREIEDAKTRIKKSLEACHYCYASKGEAAVVVPNGDMYACSSLVGIKKYYYGNILSNYKIVPLSDMELKECKSCIYYKVCKKMCPSRAILNLNGESISKEECALRKACFSIVKLD